MCRILIRSGRCGEDRPARGRERKEQGREPMIELSAGLGLCLAAGCSSMAQVGEKEVTE
jgi:hypothetical protein